MIRTRSRSPELALFIITIINKNNMSPELALFIKIIINKTNMSPEAREDGMKMSVMFIII